MAPWSCPVCFNTILSPVTLPPPASMTICASCNKNQLLGFNCKPDFILKGTMTRGVATIISRDTLFYDISLTHINSSFHARYKNTPVRLHHVNPNSEPLTSPQLLTLELLRSLPPHPLLTPLLGVCATPTALAASPWDTPPAACVVTPVSKTLNDAINSNSSTPPLSTQYAAKHGLAIPHTRKILHAIASAVAHLHAHNILHRDLKPDNVLLTNDLTTDDLREFPLTLACYGIPSSPASFLLPSDDVFSFGCIVYHVLHGAPPDLPKPKIDTTKNPTFVDLVKRCMDDDASSRPTMAEIVTILASPPTTKITVKPLQLVPDSTKKNKKLTSHSLLDKPMPPPPPPKPARAPVYTPLSSSISLSLPRILTLLSAIATELSSLHAAAVVHTKLRPSNILHDPKDGDAAMLINYPPKRAKIKAKKAPNSSSLVASESGLTTTSNATASSSTGASAAAYKQYSEIYDELDRNHDGSLTPREIILGLRNHPDIVVELGLTSETHEGASRDKLMELFHSIDINQDDDVSKDEFLAFYVRAASNSSSSPTATPLLQSKAQPVLQLEGERARKKRAPRLSDLKLPPETLASLYNRLERIRDGKLSTRDVVLFVRTHLPELAERLPLAIGDEEATTLQLNQFLREIDSWYVAPEVTANKKHTREGDVYSFGMIVFTILHSGPPAHHARKGERPTIGRGKNADLVELMTSCWSKDAKSRPTMAEISTTLSSLSKLSEFEDMPQTSTVGGQRRRAKPKQQEQAKSKMNVAVKDWLSGRAITIEVKRYTSLREVRVQVAKTLGVSADKQRLTFINESQLYHSTIDEQKAIYKAGGLDESKTLSYYNVEAGATLQVFPQLEDPWLPFITIKMTSDVEREIGKGYVRVEVSLGSDCVWDVLEKVRVATGMPLEQQRLIVKDEYVDMDKTLKELEVRHDDVLLLASREERENRSIYVNGVLCFATPIC